MSKKALLIKIKSSSRSIGWIGCSRHTWFNLIVLTTILQCQPTLNGSYTVHLLVQHSTSKRTYSLAVISRINSTIAKLSTL